MGIIVSGLFTDLVNLNLQASWTPFSVRHQGCVAVDVRDHRMQIGGSGLV